VLYCDERRLLGLLPGPDMIIVLRNTMAASLESCGWDRTGKTSTWEEWESCVRYLTYACSKTRIQSRESHAYLTCPNLEFIDKCGARTLQPGLFCNEMSNAPPLLPLHFHPAKFQLPNDETP